MKIMLLSIILVLTLCLPVQAQVSNDHSLRRLDQDNKIKRKNWPTRLGDSSDRKCKKCEEKEALARTEHLGRVLNSPRNIKYQNEIQNVIFSEERFLKKCWKRLVGEELEIFFTIDTAGRASEFMTFPKSVNTKCLKKRVQALDFPKPQSPYYAWFVAENARGK